MGLSSARAVRIVDRMERRRPLTFRVKIGELLSSSCDYPRPQKAKVLSALSSGRSSEISQASRLLRSTSRARRESRLSGSLLQKGLVSCETSRLQSPDT